MNFIFIKVAFLSLYYKFSGKKFVEYFFNIIFFNIFE